jgi:hypothetical protein
VAAAQFDGGDHRGGRIAPGAGDREFERDRDFDRDHDFDNFDRDHDRDQDFDRD